jgi:tetratricopeptide (TPR) repeat protein
MTLPRRLRPLVALLWAAGLLAQTTQDRIAAITSALSAGEFKDAVRLAQAALDQSPRDPRLWTIQGIALSAEKRRREALDAFHHALQISPDYLPALEGAAQLDYEAGSKEAVPLLQHILRLRPDDQTSHGMLGVIAYQQGDCTEAVRNFEQSGALVESQPAAVEQYGSCLVKVKQTQKAKSVFLKLVNAHPDDSYARCGLAAVQLAAGQPQDALETLQPLLEATSPETGTMQLAAAVYEANHDTPNAVKVLRQAIVKDPHNSTLYVDFANLALTHQSFQTGIDMIDAGLKVQPDAADLYLARGVLYVQLANFEQAEADFERAEQLDPAQSISAAAQGIMAEEKAQDNPDQALATVRAKLAKKPGDPFLLYLQATILSQKGLQPGSTEFRQAMQSAKRAVALQPSLSAAHDLLAKLYLQAAETELAIKECRLALRQDPKDQTALYHLILALRKTNDKTEIPDLLKRLAAARQEATAEEAEHNRYKLVIAPGAQSN